jgi:hypothetical protein
MFVKYTKINVMVLEGDHSYDATLHAKRREIAKKCILKADELQNIPSRRRLVDEFQQLQEEEKRQEMSQRGQRGGQSQSKSKSSIGRIKKREKKQKEKEVVDLVSEEED